MGYLIAASLLLLVACIAYQPSRSSEAIEISIKCPSSLAVVCTEVAAKAKQQAEVLVTRQIDERASQP